MVIATVTTTAVALVDLVIAAVSIAARESAACIVSGVYFPGRREHDCDSEQGRRTDANEGHPKLAT